MLAALGLRDEWGSLAEGLCAGGATASAVGTVGGEIYLGKRKFQARLPAQSKLGSGHSRNKLMETPLGMSDNGGSCFCGKGLV